MGYDLSILIPARNEMFLKQTIEDILEHTSEKTEIIAVLDGVWADPPIDDHPRVTLVYHSESVGQRAATNEAARISRAKYVCKMDAHCGVDQDFDLKMIQELEGHYDWTMVPRMYNLHAFDWLCPACGKRTYQGPTPEKCECGNTEGIEREMVWKPRLSRLSDYMRFDHDMHFQYFGGYKKRPEAEGDITDQMACVGACWMLHRERYFELNICDEAHGSWGQQGVEVSCKSWLSGGRQVVNKKTWFMHMFRTQGGDFGFPYKMSGRQVDKARKYSKTMWYGNQWPGQVKPLSWLIDKFAPIPGWHDPEGKEILANIQEIGKRFEETRHDKFSLGDVGRITVGDNNNLIADDIQAEVAPSEKKPKATLVYYTDNNPDGFVLEACQRTLTDCMDKWGFPIITVSQRPMDFGQNVVMDLQRSVLSMYKQILKGLETAETDIIFQIEHDLLYHPSHFDFIPARKDVYYYDRNLWRLDVDTGKAVYYQANVPSMMCAHRDFLIDHYRRKVVFVEEHGFQGKYGFSPPKGLPKELRTGKYECYRGDLPCIDLRHDKTLTRRRMDKSQFRNEPKDWTEAYEIPGWGETKEIINVYMAR